MKNWQVEFHVDGKPHYEIIAGKTAAQVRHKIRLQFPLAVYVFIDGHAWN